MPERKSKLQKYSAPALEKGLDILEFLSLTDAAPSLSQLAVGIGRSKNEIFRMMIVLEERGYIERTQGDQFMLTDRVTMLGAHRPLKNKLAELAAPVLLDLSEKTEYSCHFSALDGDSFVVVAQASRLTNYGISVQVGHRSRLLDSSPGACYLAFMPLEERSRILSLLPGGKKAVKQEFLDKITMCQANRYVSMPSPESDSICELSSPVLHSCNEGVVAVVTIPFLATDKTSNKRAEVIELLLAAAQMLRDTIGITMPNLEPPQFCPVCS